MSTITVIKKNAIVNGEIYSTALVEHYGIVNGCIYTTMLTSKTEMGYRDNYLNNAIVDFSGLSEFFVGSNIFKNQLQEKIIKCLN